MTFQRKTAFFVICIHAILLLFSRQSTSSKKEKKPRLIVETIRLKPKESITQTTVQKAAAPPQKAAVKPCQEKKEKPPPTQAKKKEAAPAKKNTPAKKNAEYAKLIHELEKQLDKIEKGGQKNISHTPTINVPSKISSLQIDRADHSVADEKDLLYNEMLATFLHQAIVLPEYGEVKLKIDIDEEGRVSQVKVIESQSKVNQRYLEKILPSLRFPRPPHHLSKTKKQSYVLTFCNEL
jgi:hypothetical protein